MAKKYTNIILFIIGSVIFLCIPIFSSPDFGKELQLFKIPMFWKTFVSYVGLLIFFYLNFFYLIPKLFFKKKYFVFIFCLVLIYVAISFVPDLFFNHQNPRFHPKPVPNDRFYDLHPIFPQNVFFQFCLVAFVSLLIKINMRLKEVESEKLKSEVAYLRAQINPHFLFNTLNGIYALALERSESTADAVFRLSGMMRYAINESQKSTVSIEKEFEYIHHYLALQKLRITPDTILEYNIESDDNSLQIPPLLLISFIENAFKYGLNPEKESMIDICIKVKNNQLYSNIKNSIVAKPYEEEKSSIGILNTKKRLELLFPKKHKLSIFESDDFFNVELIIDLNAERDRN